MLTRKTRLKRLRQEYYDPTRYDFEELLRDHASFIQPSQSNRGNTASQQSRVAELESEVQRLREQLGRAKYINDTMWDTVVQRMVAEKKGANAAMDTAEDAPRKDKRLRT